MAPKILFHKKIGQYECLTVEKILRATDYLLGYAKAFSTDQNVRYFSRQEVNVGGLPFQNDSIGSVHKY